MKELQNKIINELKTVFDGLLLSNQKNERVPINIYPQYLPPKSSSNEIDYFPFIVVKLVNGQDDEEKASCKVIFIIGIYDSDTNYQGYDDIINIIEKIRINFISKRLLANKYELELPVEWSISEEESYPFFYGGIETNWQLPKALEDETRCDI